MSQGSSTVRRVVATCPHCAQENPEIARFCLACGKPLEEQDPKREERRIVSVIFVDLVGFTGAAEKLDPEDVHAVLGPYHEAVRTRIESFGGVVEKFIGDAVMGVFGAPTAFGDDAERAVRAGLAVRDEVAGGEVGPLLQLRIAVNTGEALVTLNARPGLGEAMVAGDVVNTASRLQSAAAPNSVIVGEETWRATRDAIQYEACEHIVAKGKSATIPTWAAVCAATPHGERVLSSTFVGPSSMTNPPCVWENALHGKKKRTIANRINRMLWCIEIFLLSINRTNRPRADYELHPVVSQNRKYISMCVESEE